MNSPYTGNVNTMTQNELEQALVDLAGRWRVDPYLSNDGSEAKRYQELVFALKNRFSVTKAIHSAGGSTDYQVV